MAQSDLKSFLEDLILRYDPLASITDGSRARTALIDPILRRVGLDPFDTDITTFIRESIRQRHPDMDISDVDALTDTVVDPMRTIIEPLVREVKLIRLRSSVRNGESLSDAEVDSLMGNFFESRVRGSLSRGRVRAYFTAPQTVSISQINVALGPGGLRFFPTRPQQITSEAMALNPEGSEYYFDIAYEAEFAGSEYDVAAGSIRSIANLPSAARVTNARRFANGTPRETNVEFLGRTQGQLSERTLSTEPGILRVVSDAFTGLRQLFSVGFRDPEMQRDVIRGGGLGRVPDDDTLGSFYGTATPVDALDGSSSTAIIEAASGFFVDRIGAVGYEPTEWVMSIVYDDGGLVSFDANVLEVLSATQVLLDRTVPLVLSTDLAWTLRRYELTISEIPGGVMFPTNEDGTTTIVGSDGVHIGGKTDIYAAGGVETSSVTISRLTDEQPVTKGRRATTDATDVVTLLDLNTSIEIKAGMSLVLMGGVDANSYRIIQIEVGGDPTQIQLIQAMTGTQLNLPWQIVNDIDVELTSPKNLVVDGADLITSAGSATVVTAGALNFVEMGVRPEYILEIEGDEVAGGEYVIDTVNPTDLVLRTPVPRTLALAPYRIFERFEAVQAPIVRVESMELVDAAGATVGVSIPHRDPVLTLSQSFGNEGAGFVFESPALVGLVFGNVVSDGTYPVGTLDLEWVIYDLDKLWAGSIATGTFTFAAGLFTTDQVVAALNADADWITNQVRAVKIQYGGFDFVGVAAGEKLFMFEGGTALADLGIQAGLATSCVRSLTDPSLSRHGVRTGDLIEVMEGHNTGRTSRFLTTPTGAEGFGYLGDGPTGSASSPGLYGHEAFIPDIARVRVGRPSVGSARVYFPLPTSVDFDYRETRFTTEGLNRTLVYRPDPENTRVIRPPPPGVDLPNNGLVDPGSGLDLQDTTALFLTYGVVAGDLLDIEYRPITGTAPLSAVGDISVGGLTLGIRRGTLPVITVKFPYAMPRQDVVDYINEQIGSDIAELAVGGELVLAASSYLEVVEPGSTVLTTDPLFLDGAPRTNKHPLAGTYVIAGVTDDLLTLSLATPLDAAGPAVPDTHYRIRRHVQRTSSTEMDLQLDASGLYYADVELLAIGPGDDYNIRSDVSLRVTGHRGDGFRLETESSVTSYSRAEVLYAQISRSILVPGAPDSPEEYTQLSRQGVLVTYDRSQIIDDIQSFVDSPFNRIPAAEHLVRHLLPSYILLNWSYTGGAVASEMRRALETLLDGLEPDSRIEVSAMVNAVIARGGVGVFTPDSTNPSGRTAPFFVVLYHNVDRSISGALVRDSIITSRSQRFLPEDLSLTRLTTGGIR